MSGNAGETRASGSSTSKPLVILCRTQMGENVGTAARAMLNFGLTELRLVRPECGWPNAKAVAAASGAVQVLNGLRAFASLEAALHDVQHVLATSARARELDKEVLDGEAAGRRAHALVGAGRRIAFLFGPERTGLTNDELLLADAVVSFPVNPSFASLNLAQAVLLQAYEWHRSAAAAVAEPAAHPVSSAAPATKAEVAGAVGHLVGELDAVDFFRSPGRRASLIGAVTVLLERRAMTTPEVHLLRGIIKDLSGGRRARRRAE